MRLKTSYADSLKTVHNTLTQRVQGPLSETTVEIDVFGLKDGNTAGFGTFELPYAYVGVEQPEGIGRIMMCDDGKNIEVIDNFTGNKLWVRIRVMDMNFCVTLYYSLNGKIFIPIGNDLNIGLGLVWTVNRFVLLNFTRDKADEDGYADFN